ncbi:hypothetical protein [Salisediminibacterium halotolerans]|uniref:hypothetical protein n=1 Tax=Salisediminibacterium halotolerans TaxID=517425 RepID=UPI000EAB6683|nr:hypothetical protein [Salisediminibacterium halotolerans]RLJ72270.1 hypothetical protein BCL39_2169 [Actinophytocola xinjiangensis]RPE85484.1 hypothetical protein EDD67_2304 [Salisediminibacterium halotolerans]TWG33439.1 hypothetical protein BCL52_2164 [Salisediminibacterium halotolerans]GEL07051.1 hypothetical protein SHA02_04670 [Salisediminibacterium halotolerans]
MSNFWLTVFPLILLNIEALVRLRQIRRYGLAEKTSAMQYLVMAVALISVLTIVSNYVSGAFWLIIVIVVLLVSKLIYSSLYGFSKLTVYQSSKHEVEEVIDSQLRRYEERLQKKENEDKSEIQYIIEDTKEKLKLTWDKSPLNSDYADNVALQVDSKFPSELAEEWPEIKDKLVRLNAQKNIKRRLLWESIFAFSGILVVAAIIAWNVLIF